MNIVDELRAMRQHTLENPKHGLNCSCKDGNLRRIRIKDLWLYCRNSVTIQFYIEILFFLEIADLSGTFHQHGKCRCLNPSNGQLFEVLCGVSSGCIHSYQPVSLRTAYSSFGQMSVFLCGSQMLHSIKDC